MAEDGGKVVTDPMSSALVLAGKGAGEAVTPKLRELLFGPIAKAYGDHWGAEAEERLRKKREEKRAKNAYAHLNAVAQLTPRHTFEDISDDPLFGEWLAGASAVDPEIDPDLANFWRAALVALAQGDASRLRLVRIARSLGPDDAVYLATGTVHQNWFSPARDRESVSDYPRRLEEAGVFETLWYPLRRRPIGLLALIFIPTIMYASLSLFSLPVFNNFPEKSALFLDLIDRISLPMSIIVLAMIAMLIISRLTTSSRHLTVDGIRLFELLERVRQTQSDTEAVVEDTEPAGRERTQ